MTGARVDFALGLEDVVGLLAERTGLALSADRRAQVEPALERAILRYGARSAPELAELLTRDVAMLDDLVAEITVGETYFFRDPGQFDFVRGVVAPALRPRATRSQPLRVWSAACATGEEAYSLAILLFEAGLLPQTRIVATDIARSRLAAARRGSYGAWSLRSMPEQVKARYFAFDGKRYVLAPAIRESVEFRYVNLACDPFPSAVTGLWGMDLIFCRNALMYFRPDVVAHVARALLASLGEGGWLLLGAADPPLLDLPCEVTLADCGLVYRRSGAGVPVPRRGITPDQLPRPSPVGLESPVAPFQQPVRTPAPQPQSSISDDGPSISDDGGPRASQVEHVRSLLRAGEYREAARVCLVALERDPTCAELLYLHAVLLAESGRLQDAVAAGRRALYLEPRMIVAHFVIGSSLVRLGERAAARTWFRRAERLLSELQPGAPVPAADDEPADRLLEMTRVQLALLSSS